MTAIHIKRYYPKAKPLKHLIKYFWVLDSDRPLTLNHKILPVTNIDILFNFLAPMTFERDGQSFETPGNIFFSGLSEHYTLMKQEGFVLTIGVSFFPAGFYPFFKIPVAEFKNDIFGLDAGLGNVAVEIEEKLRETDRISEKIAVLEQFFLGLLDQNALLPFDTGRLLNLFDSSHLGVRDFCRDYGVHARKLERLFNQYVGVTPKRFLRLSRFQAALNRLMGLQQDDLTTVAHELEFYDQPHFIKDFKSFTGSAPRHFLKEKRSVKQIMKLS